MGEAILIVFWLVLLEGILSIDNALVLSMMVMVLPREQQKKALTYGIWGAFIFRIIAVFLALVLIKLWWLKLLGGGYLLYVAYKGLCGHGLDPKSARSANFWAVVLQVELMDIAFSIDSILAGVALSEKTWVVILGGMLGIILMRFAAQFFMKLIDKYPALKRSAYILVAVIGLRLAVSVWWHAPGWLFFGILFLILAVALVKGKKTYRPS